MIFCRNSHEKLTKSEIRSNWSRFEHCSITRLASSNSYLVIIGPNSHANLTKFDICVIFTCIDILLLELHICDIFLEHNFLETNRHGDIAFQRIGGYRKWHHECSLGVNLVNDIFM